MRVIPKQPEESVFDDVGLAAFFWGCSRLAIRQWSLAPEQKICVASLHISANLILNHYIGGF
ncbi:MAG TPA: hypothetical protein VLE95_02870 [Chlamydiales bacterium]|nr:hypothetical protein [Chlamydiales bacterium]